MILLLLCLAGATGCGLWLNFYMDKLPVPFLPLGQFQTAGEMSAAGAEPDPFYQAFLAFWTYVIILQVMIPLSLYVTIELAKLVQIFHIHHDPQLKDPVTGKRIECRALNITEELGQIQYIFSDKTGTLTENNMIFRRCSVGGIDYNHPPVAGSKDAPPLKAGERQKIYPNLRLQEELRQFELQRRAALETTDFEDRPVHINVQARRLEEFFLLMAVCNTVVVAKKPHRDRMNEVGQIENSTVVVGGADGSNQAVHIVNQQAVDDSDGSLSVISERDSTLSLDPNSMTLIVPRPVTTSTPSATPGNVTPKRPGNLFFFSGIDKGFCMPSALIFLFICQEVINFKCNHIKIVYFSRTAFDALPTYVSAAERTTSTVTHRLVCRNNTVRVSSASSQTALPAIAQSRFSPFFLQFEALVDANVRHVVSAGHTIQRPEASLRSRESRRAGTYRRFLPLQHPAVSALSSSRRRLHARF